ncbi:MAG: BCCT family transporter [Chromatiales bacterium]|nr:BCCT family transporter [Chromatiales bacterium]
MSGRPSGPGFSGLVVHPWVFGASVTVIVAFIVATLSSLATAELVFSRISTFITAYFGWFLVLSVQGFLLTAIYFALSRFGHIRIGGLEARPEYSRLSWFAMLFSAGMGIGLMFWSVAEPVTHLQAPPGAEGMTSAGAMRAMDLTFLHWGLHAWGVYALVGLSLAYFHFNRGLPLTIRSAFQPLLGRHINGPAGTVIDVLAVVATLFGVATSLGLGVSQINAGLHYLAGIPVSVPVQLVLIVGITLVATLSVVAGLDRGIKRLSQLNLVTALMLLAFVLLAGPTLFLLKSFVQHTGHYLQNLLTLGSWTETYVRDTSWQADWTVFYWAWWIAWSPFVGMFIARISRGRTVREFVLGVLLVPSVFTFIWITVFGGTAVHEALFMDAGIVEQVNRDVSTALFALLQGYPFAMLTSALAIVLIFVFFITSSDSGSLVIDIITSGGRLNPPVAQRVFWALGEGVVAGVLLVGGGLVALRTAAIAAGLPFAIVLAVMAWCLWRAFSAEVPPPRPAGRPPVASPGG